MTRSFLFLQGPPGPFFAQLGRALQQHGHRVLRIHLNGGDLIDWPFRGTRYCGSIAQWDTQFRDIATRETITDLVLFGDCRPLHRIAIAAARGLGLAVHVFEEGYIRPDWVTLEQGGVNGHSSLPRDLDFYLRAAAGLATVPVHAPLPGSFWNRSRATIRYYGATWLLAPLFPHYRSHRPETILAEARGWLRRLAHTAASHRRTSAALRRIGQKPYFALPMQLDSDYQLRVHSSFDGMTEPLSMIMGSFARHAPSDVHLIVKEHPLDNGLHDWRGWLRHEAERLGIGDRIVHIEAGDVTDLVTRALGVVTVNSTTGTLALAAGVPVKTLGRAIYDIAGITHQGLLDDFWTNPIAPQFEIFEAFRRVLVDRCLLRGGFSSIAGRALLLVAAAERLIAAAPLLSVECASTRLSAIE